jgi:hypothetical protein
MGSWMSQRIPVNGGTAMSESSSAEDATKAAETARDLATEAAEAAEKARTAAQEAAGAAAPHPGQSVAHERSWTKDPGGDYVANVDLSSGGGAETGGPVDD